MKRVHGDKAFDTWIEHILNPPVGRPLRQYEDPRNCCGDDWDVADDRALTLAYLTRLFQTPAFLLERYSRVQIDDALRYIVSNCHSDYMHVLSDTNLPWPDREACIKAMCNLYAEYMAPVYGNDIAFGRHKQDPARPNFSCYMWWDVIALHGDLPESKLINMAVFHVLRETLKLQSEACLESALHGLSIWGLYEPEEAGSIVRQFLATRADLSPRLREYAKAIAMH